MSPSSESTNLLQPPPSSAWAVTEPKSKLREERWLKEVFESPEAACPLPDRPSSRSRLLDRGRFAGQRNRVGVSRCGGSSQRDGNRVDRAVTQTRPGGQPGAARARAASD